MNGKGEKTMGDTKKENDNIIEFGQAMLHADRRNTTIYLLSIIGEIEGHECLPSTSKTTKYEHVLPRLAAIEDDESVNGVLLLLNTMGEMWRADLRLRKWSRRFRNLPFL